MTTFLNIAIGFLLCLILALAFLPFPVLAEPTTYDFAGTFGGWGGTVQGSWTVDTAGTPIAVNVRGHENQIYSVTSAFTVTPNFGTVPNLTGSLTEYCTGACVFATPTPTVLQLQTQFQTLRIGFDQNMQWSWGDLTTTNPNGSFNSLLGMSSGTITAQSVPEPTGSTLLISAIGVAWLLRRAYS